MTDRLIWLMLMNASLLVFVFCWGLVIGTSINVWNGEYSLPARLGIVASVSVFGWLSSALLLIGWATRPKR